MSSYVWGGAGKHSTVLLNHLDISHPTTRTLDQGHVSYSLLAGAGLHSVLGDILRLNRVAMSYFDVVSLDGERPSFAHENRTGNSFWEKTKLPLG